MIGRTQTHRIKLRNGEAKASIKKSGLLKKKIYTEIDLSQVPRNLSRFYNSQLQKHVEEKLKGISFEIHEMHIIHVGQ